MNKDIKVQILKGLRNKIIKKFLKFVMFPFFIMIDLLLVYVDFVLHITRIRKDSSLNVDLFYWYVEL